MLDILELCSKDNRVLTKYPEDRVYLLVAIDTDTGEYAPLDEVDNMAQALHLHRPKYFKAKDERIHTLDSFLEWVEEKSRSPEFPPVRAPFSLAVALLNHNLTSCCTES